MCFQTSAPDRASAPQSSTAVSLHRPEPFSVMRENRSMHQDVLGMGAPGRILEVIFCRPRKRAIPQHPAQREEQGHPSEVRGQTFLGTARVQANFEDCSYASPGGSVQCLRVSVRASQAAD